jgi:tyrosinase
MPRIYVSPPIDTSSLLRGFYRADLVFRDLDHSGPTFEGRVFLDNPRATADTAKTAEHGYAGSFFVFGHGACWGGAGHCDVRMPRPYDPRPAHPLVPLDKVVIATEALRRALAARTPITVTVVPLAIGAAPDDLLAFSRVEIVAYE